MSFRAYCFSCLILVIIGVAVAPGPKSSSIEKEKKPPAPPKREGQTQEEYAKEILKGRSITEFPPEELPIPDRNIPKYILTDDSATVEGFLKKGGFVSRFVETWVVKVEDNTAFRLTVQNHWNNFLLCVQRIRIYEELETPEQMKKRLAANSEQNSNPVGGQSSARITDSGAVSSTRTPIAQGLASSRTPATEVKASIGDGTTENGKKSKPPRRKFKAIPREDILAKCEGGFDFKPHTRYRFGFADAIYFYGANRIIYKMLNYDPKEKGFFCHERSYTVAGKKDQFIDEQQCKTRIERIFTLEGTMRNLLWNLFHHPMSFVRGRAFQEK